MEIGLWWWPRDLRGEIEREKGWWHTVGYVVRGSWGLSWFWVRAWLTRSMARAAVVRGDAQFVSD